MRDDDDDELDSPEHAIAVALAREVMVQGFEESYPLFRRFDDALQAELAPFAGALVSRDHVPSDDVRLTPVDDPSDEEARFRAALAAAAERVDAPEGFPAKLVVSPVVVMTSDELGAVRGVVIDVHAVITGWLQVYRTGDAPVSATGRASPRPRSRRRRR